MRNVLLALALAACISVLIGQAPTAPAAGQPAPAAKNPAPTAPTAPPPPPKEWKPTDVVMTVGQEKITYEQWRSLEQGLPQQYKQVCQQMGKRECANQFGLILGLARIAEQDKLDQTQEFKDQMSFARLQLLMQMAFQNLQNRGQVVTPEDVKKYYAANIAEYEQLKLRGIFVSLTPPARPGQGDAKNRTDEEAKQAALALRKKIVDGADFSAVAKESSDEQGTGAKGGDFGTVRKGQLPPRIEKAIFALKVSEVSEPVQEARGYYLFRVEERKTTTYEEASQEILSKLQQEKVLGVVENVKKEYAVKCVEEFCGPEPKPAAPAPAPVKQ